MKKITLFFLLVSFISFSQEQFTYGGNGLNKTFVVNKAGNLTQQQLFDKTTTWIKSNFQKSDVPVTKEVEGNSKITFIGLKKNYINFSAIGNQIFFNVRYTIGLAFKDGRYKFEVVKIEKKAGGHNQKGREWSNIPLNNGSKLYGKNGKLTPLGKAQSVKIPKLLNELNKNLLNHLTSVAKAADNGDW